MFWGWFAAALFFGWLTAGVICALQDRYGVIMSLLFTVGVVAITVFALRDQEWFGRRAKRDVDSVDFTVDFPARETPAEGPKGLDAPDETAETEKPMAFGTVIEAEPTDTLADMVGRADLCVVDFNSELCGPCKILAPKLSEMAAEFQNAVFWSADIQKCPSVVFDAGGICSVPCVKIFLRGEEVGEVVGNYPARIKGLILSILKE